MSTRIPTNMHGLGYLRESDVPINYGGAVGAVDVWDGSIAQIGNAVDSLFTDIHDRMGRITSQSGGAGFVRNYLAFHGEWHGWLRNHDDGWELAYDHLNVRRALLGFVRRYNQFEGAYRRFTGEQPSNPGVPDPPGAPGLPAWGWALIVIGGVAATGVTFWAVSRVLREGRLLATEF